MSEATKPDAATAAVCIYEIFAERGMAPGVYGPVAEEIINKIEGYVQQAIDDAAASEEDDDCSDTVWPQPKVVARYRLTRIEEGEGSTQGVDCGPGAALVAEAIERAEGEGGDDV